MARQKVGSLSCLTRPGDHEGHDVVILHGFGADAGDLYPLAEYLDPEESWNFYFPDAPYEVDIGGGFRGRGWFPISVRELETGVDFTQVRPPRLDESARAVADLIFELNSKKVILGGFSQGAMIAMEVAITDPDSVSGLVIWSGSLLDEKGWRAKVSGLKDKPFVQSHGMQDTVLPFSVGERLNALLTSGGGQGEFIRFAGGHEIPPPVIRKTKDFLQGLAGRGY